MSKTLVGREISKQIIIIHHSRFNSYFILTIEKHALILIMREVVDAFGFVGENVSQGFHMT